ncbi:DUF2855 family protein [Cognaticolwellia mytili]|uniref:DUF2855 family protein n=1 Tax=Cognaticolwellia mytili TaxID=1888913 RepID=UPI000A172098|nr:DUF2855 family protein [Cognaticolwellia mytili]
MSTVNATVFEVERLKLQNTRHISTELDTELEENELILKIDKFALTANNISYGIAGDTLGYWNFFPTLLPWGRIPAMGFSEVMVSNCSEIAVGERIWGFVPMASHVKVLAGKVSATGFFDLSEHRAGLSPVYASFERVKQNPFYKQENEDFEMLVRGLFTTSWLIEDFMFDQNYFSAEQYLITSASSKTSIALAFAIKARGDLTAVGITSNSNRKFVESLGCYDKVISYDEITHLDSSAPSILVDMAGSQKTLAAIHTHFIDQLRYSCRIGATHHHDLVPNELSTKSTLPGVVPTFFFAPTQLKKRTNDWGAIETMNKIGQSLQGYITFCHTIMTIEHSTGKAAINKAYQEVLLGKADASIGKIISL